MLTTVMSFAFGAKLVTTPHLQVYHTLSTRPRLIHTHSVIRYGAIDFVSKVNCQRHDSVSVSASGKMVTTSLHRVASSKQSGVSSICEHNHKRKRVNVARLAGRSYY